jgi:hypothetical protein
MSRSLIDELVSRWLGDRTLTAEQLCRDHPDLLPEVRKRLRSILDGPSTLHPSPEDDPRKNPTATLAGYRVAHELGRGPRGVVYLAYDPSLAGLVALEQLPAWGPGEEQARQSFQAEAGAVARLADPNIARVFAAGEEDGRPWVAREYVERGTLASALGAGPHDPRESARLVMLLARAVQHAHERGVVHRAIEPANVLLARPGNPAASCAWGCPKVAGFDLARRAGAPAESAPEALAYLAPEQAAGQADRVGPATDVYSLGAILYRLLTGQVPFEADSAPEVLDRLLTQPPAPPADVPPELGAACLKCLEKEPGKRWGSAAELAEELERYLVSSAAKPGRPGCGSLFLGGAVAALVALLAGLARGEAPARPELVEVARIWDRAPHGAFTDLVRFKDRWLCVFREGKGHVSPDGAVRVLASADGKRWESAARLASKTADLRDPKVTVTPDGRLQLSAAAALHDRRKHSHQTLTWFSPDGKDWGEPVPVGEPDYWLWRIAWHGKTAYGVGYGCGKVRDTRLYSSPDGKAFSPLVLPLFSEGSPNEHALLFQPGGTCLCLLRRDGKPNTALLGSAKPPYKEWVWKDTGVRAGGPNMIRLPDGRLIAVVRLYAPRARTAVCALDPAPGKLTELLALPSGGDTSYAGLAWYGGLLWVSYYSSHEGKTSIYLAKVRFPDGPRLR